jgi:hypothetical protein
MDQPKRNSGLREAFDWDMDETSRRRPAQPEMKIYVLNSKLPSLEISQSAQPCRKIVVDVARGIPHWEGTHRQNSQERSLASIL